MAIRRARGWGSGKAPRLRDAKKEKRGGVKVGFKKAHNDKLSDMKWKTQLPSLVDYPAGSSKRGRMHEQVGKES